MNKLEDLEKKILENKAELDKNMQKLEKSIIELSNLIKSENKPTERWEPSKGEIYKSILSDGSVGEYQFIGDAIDRKRIQFGNAFHAYMPLDDVVMMHQFINEIELICWRLNIIPKYNQAGYIISHKNGRIFYMFNTRRERDSIVSMLSDKVKEWLGI